MNLMEKSLSLGLGFFVYSREKIEELVEELANKGEIAKKDARQFTSDLIKRGEEQRDELKKIIKEEVSDVMTNMNIATKSDIIAKEELAQIVRDELTKILKENNVIK